jgi:hypothetical protein
LAVDELAHQAMHTRRRLVSMILATGVAGALTDASVVARGEAMSLEEDVESSVRRFYDAYRQVLNGNPEPMLELWSHEPYVSTMHGLGDYQLGWKAIEAAWKQVSETVSEGTMEFELVQSHVNGDIATVVGIERGTIVMDSASVDFDLRATNVFERSDGDWKAIHHHADLLTRS